MRRLGDSKDKSNLCIPYRGEALEISPVREIVNDVRRNVTNRVRVGWDILTANELAVGGH